MFILPLCGCFRHRLVEILDARSQSCNLFSQGGDSVLGGSNCAVFVRHLTLQAFLLVIGEIELIPAVLLLVVIPVLFLDQNLDHLIDHFENLVESSRCQRPLATQRQHKEVQAGVSVVTSSLTCSTDHSQSPTPHSGSANADLNKAGPWAWKGLLEQLQSIVIIQNFDRVSQRNLLLRTGLRALLPFRCFCFTAFCKACQELFVLHQALLGVRKVLLHLLQIDTRLADLGRLGLNR
mmetsp:Transcript_29921/g.67889  ORF Transcript_29921/g.67889 Transcript_29921/m.67889 type:complete len:236 (-) Transcript_29921:817-1524(-)